MIERSEIQFGLTTIPFEVRRSARRQTVALAVDASGDVKVTAPSHVPLDRLDDLVRRKATWVVQRVKRASDRPPPLPPREFVTGETVLYLGRQYRLKTVEASDGPITLKAGWLLVPVRGESPSWVRVTVAAWLRERAAVSLPSRLTDMCMRYKIEKPVLVICDQRARWGSCDARGTLRINWRIIQAPVALIDYVLLHEVTHLVHPHHGPAFWTALGRKMPDYEVRRDRLRLLGPDLVW